MTDFREKADIFNSFFAKQYSLINSDSSLPYEIIRFLFNFLNQNDLISPVQPGFKPGDSCMNQVLSITDEIYHSMNEGHEIRGVFLDISKAFDKVWHEGLFFQLKQNGISGNLLNIFEDFLRNRKQRVVLSGTHQVGKIYMQVFPKAQSWDHCCP